MSSKNNANASWLKGNLHRRFSRESLCENEKHVFLQRYSCTPSCHRRFSRESSCENTKNVPDQWSPRTPVIATFTENPAARIKKAKTANKKNTQRSKPATGNHDNKKHRLRRQCFTCIFSLSNNDSTRRKVTVQRAVDQTQPPFGTAPGHLRSTQLRKLSISRCN